MMGGERVSAGQLYHDDEVLVAVFDLKSEEIVAAGGNVREAVERKLTRQNNEIVNKGELNIAPEDVVSSFYRVQDGIRRGEITTVKGVINVILEAICGEERVVNRR